MQIQVPVSYGELLDKISILRIKAERIHDVSKRSNVGIELELLEPAARSVEAAAAHLDGWLDRLGEVNTELWEIEDEIRRCEAASDFGDRFVELARSVYLTNDRRAAIKKEINLAVGSTVVEEKSYEEY